MIVIITKTAPGGAVLFWYDRGMKYVLAIVVFFAVGFTDALANELTLTEVSLPYEIVPIDTLPETKHVYLGKLDNFPIMYEVTVTEPVSLTAQLSQRYKGQPEPIGFSLMMVRQDDTGGGVTEVARLRTEVSDWTRKKDSAYGMSFWETEILSREVKPGTYRIEVSTPENIGRYRLTFGEINEPVGYFATLAQVRATQKFFGYSFMRMLTSSYIYYPLGIFLLLIVIHRTWKYRKTIAHVG